MKKNQSNPELFFSEKALKPISSIFASAAQLTAIFPGHNVKSLDSLLRRIANQINPRTQEPYFPSAIRGKWNVEAVRIGYIEYLQDQAERRSGFPETFATQSDFAAQTPFTVDMLDFARKNGCRCVLPGGRVDFRAFLEFIAAQGIEKLDIIDGDYENKRLTRERADEQSMLNAEKRGELLFNMDEQLAIKELAVTPVLFDQFLAPAKKKLLELSKRHGFYEHIKDWMNESLKNIPAAMADNGPDQERRASDSQTL